MEGQSSWLNTTEPTRTTRFVRPKINIAKTLPRLGYWRIGATGERERSERYASDTLQSSSFFYDRYVFSVGNPDTSAFQVGANLSRRTDYVPLANAFRRNADATEFNLQSQWSRSRLLQMTGLFTYRTLAITDTTLTTQRSAETFLGRLDVALNAWKGALRANTTYEIGSGQEPKVEFTYVKVAQGSGTHIWLDSLYNNDGKIQLNEMEVAPFADQADYVRVSIYTNEFIRTNNVNLNQSLQMDLKPLWYNRTGWRKWLSRISTQSSLSLSRKTLQATGIQPWNPFQLDIADTALVSLTANQRHTLFFDRSNPRFDLQLGQADNRSRIVQTTGYEARRLTEYSIRSRWNLTTTLSIVCSATQGDRTSDSEFFNNKDYTLRYYKLEPQLTYLPNKNFRIIGGYKFQQDQNTLGDQKEGAKQHDLSLETTFNKSAQSQYKLQASYINVQFNGEAASPVGFAILNGLQPGRNWLWSAGINRQLSRSLTLSLNYEGRQTGEARTVHVGRAQVTAVF